MGTFLNPFHFMLFFDNFGIYIDKNDIVMLEQYKTTFYMVTDLKQIFF